MGAAEPELGLEDGAVLSALDATRAEVVEVALEASPIVGPLRKSIGSAWTGTMAELLSLITSNADTDAVRRNTWPKTPRGLSGMLARLAPVLKDDGILVEKLPRTGTERRWSVKKTARPSQPSPASPPAESLRKPADGGGDADARRHHPSRGPTSPRPSNPASSDARDGHDGRNVHFSEAQEFDL